jgi:hypothetical protein
MASQANIYIDQGSDYRVDLTLFDGDDDPLPIDVLDFFADIRKVYSTSTPLVSFAIEKIPAESTITLVLTDTQTRSLKPGKYQYDVLMRKQSGEMSKILEGLAFIVDTITEV